MTAQPAIRVLGFGAKGQRVDKFVHYREHVAIDVPGGRVEFHHNGAAESGLIYGHLTYVPIRQGLTTFTPRMRKVEA